MRRELVAGLIISKGKLLLLHNMKHGGLRVEPPGGKVHAGEALEDSLKREVREEIGVEVSVRSLFGTYWTRSPEGEFPVHMFMCDIKGGEPRVMEGEKFSGLGWYGYEDIGRLKEEGSLVGNMASALPALKGLLR